MIKRLISKIYSVLFNFVASIFPVKKDTILFESFNGKLPSDNPYAIYTELTKKDSDKQAYWGIKKNLFHEAQKEFPNLNFVPRFSVKWLWITSRAEFWIFNARMPHWLKKNKGTTYIQTWHGTPLKKIGIDILNVSMPDTDTMQYRKNFLFETQRWDYLIAPNKYSKEIFKQAFQFKNNFLEVGYPRNDELVNNKENMTYKEQLKKKILGNKEGKVILYAPTWRDDYFIKKGNYKFYMPFKLNKILSILNKEDTLVIRPHYLVGDSIDISGFENQVKICVNENINELYLISDLLITDYSSVMFDFAILSRPMLFYPYDLEHYQDDLRDFYFPYEKEELPGPIAKNEQELYKFIQEYLSNDSFVGYEEKAKNFSNKFSSWEKGTSSEKTLEIIKKGK